MIWKMYSVQDTVASVFMPPFLARTPQEATRMCVEAARDRRPGNMVADYPHQFFLMEIGTWDDTAAELAPYRALNSIGPISSFLEAPEASQSS